TLVLSTHASPKEPSCPVSILGSQLICTSKGPLHSYYLQNKGHTQEVRSHQQFQCNFRCNREMRNLSGAVSVANLVRKRHDTFDSTCEEDASGKRNQKIPSAAALQGWANTIFTTPTGPCNAIPLNPDEVSDQDTKNTAVVGKPSVIPSLDTGTCYDSSTTEAEGTKIQLHPEDWANPAGQERKPQEREPGWLQEDWDPNARELLNLEIDISEESGKMDVIFHSMTFL
ncbi:hypothetical protein P7K49_009241, partial [Saguinus oedipus]